MAVWSQIQYSKAKEGNRFDAEYYQPSNLSLLAALQKSQPKPLGELAFVTDGIHASPEVVEDGGVRYLSAKCVKDNDFALTDTLFISDQQNAANRRTQLRSGDVLITTVGTIGNAAVVQPDCLPANADRHLGIVRLKETCGIDPYFLTTFLNSRYGRFQTWREATGNVQLNLFIDKIKNLLVPIMSFQNAVASMTKRAYDKRRETEALYAAAESDLNAALGLDCVNLAPELFYEGRFSQVAAVGRFDAEHFQPKFAALIDTLRNTGIELQTLGEIIKPVKNGFDCRDFCDEGTPYIRVGDVKQGRIEVDGCARIPLKARDLPKDVSLAVGDILFTRKGSFGNAAHVRPGQEHAIISSEIMLIRRKTAFLQTILPEYLALYFNSKAGALQAEKWAHGVAFYSISQDDLARFVIPILPMPKQKDLKAKTDEAESALQESRRLLDTAKHAVEIAIEDGEEAARKFLDQ
jgi:type I restriction enzyme M protein